MTTKREYDANHFIVEVVNLIDATEPFSLSEALSEAEWLGLKKRFDTKRRRLELLIGFRGGRRIAAMAILHKPKDKATTHQKSEIENRLELLGCDKYIAIVYRSLA